MGLPKCKYLETFYVELHRAHVLIFVSIFHCALRYLAQIELCSHFVQVNLTYREPLLFWDNGIFSPSQDHKSSYISLLLLLVFFSSWIVTQPNLTGDSEPYKTVWCHELVAPEVSETLLNYFTKATNCSSQLLSLGHCMFAFWVQFSNASLPDIPSEAVVMLEIYCFIYFS